MNGGLPRKVLVIGGSGAMGSRVINHVGRDAAGETCTFRVLTRNPDTRACRELGQRLGNRVEFARGSVSDALHVQQALCGIDTVFANTSYWSYFQQAQGGEAVDAARVGRSHRQALSSEIRDGVMLLEAARREGVRHFVYSSLDAMDRPSGGRCPAPHFDAKAEHAAGKEVLHVRCGDQDADALSVPAAGAALRGDERLDFRLCIEVRSRATAA
jgi:nucleoside-diphosphate-sugar epimerase